MSAAVEQHARAHVVTEADTEDLRAIPVDLRYDPAAAPRSVRLSFPEAPGAPAHDWVFARELLEKGLRGPAASGDVRVWPCGRAGAVVELHSPDGVALIQFDTSTLLRFLRRTHAAAGRGGTAPRTAGRTT
ncbi:SsgA family sporulation/cell division regulator [Streptomyces sp. NPDC058045]|uniref:SsgA family sporulation/cell division regulator n=1 Tax=Streptomyces sp. NPDC058045 TaxID=3346311 RepID=UPI0036F15A8A